MISEGEVLDVVKGAGELDSLLDEDGERVLLAGVNLLDVDLIDVSVQAGLGQSGDEEFWLELFDDLGRVVELNVRNPKLWEKIQSRRKFQRSI